MRRITLVTAICVAATTMLIAGWKFGAPAPKAVIATADAAAAANLIAPFELRPKGKPSAPSSVTLWHRPSGRRRSAAATARRPGPATRRRRLKRNEIWRDGSFSVICGGFISLPLVAGSDGFHLRYRHPCRPRAVRHHRNPWILGSGILLYWLKRHALKIQLLDLHKKKQNH